MNERHALLITASEYADPRLDELRATAADAEILASVLNDPRIGDFKTDWVNNQPYHKVGESVGAFLSERSPSDTLLLYISGHGLKNEDGELHFAASDTRLNQLDDTTLSASRVWRQIERCRSRSVIVLIDCCFAGAFPSGMSPKGRTDLRLPEFQGDGRVVIAASSSTEYAFVGSKLEVHEPSTSVFTSAVVLGLRSGDADIDRDGIITPSDLFDYVSESLRVDFPQQKPVMHAAGLRGRVRLASNPHANELGARPSPMRSPTSSASAGEPAHFSPLSDLMDGYLDQVEAISNREDFGSVAAEGFISTGLEELDEATGGYRLGDLVLVTGTTGSGKSNLLLNTIRAAAVHSNVTSLLLTLETGHDEAIGRIFAAECRIPLNHIQRGYMTDDDWAKMARRMGEVSSAPLFIEGQRPADLRAYCSELSSRHALRVVAIDNLQLLAHKETVEELVGMTRTLKLLAKELGVVMVASVLQEPTLGDRGGPLTAIDRYADLVINIYRDDLNDDESLRPGEADLMVLRNRRGFARTATVAFQGHYGRFVDMASPGGRGS